MDCHPDCGGCQLRLFLTCLSVSTPAPDNVIPASAVSAKTAVYQRQCGRWQTGSTEPSYIPLRPDLRRFFNQVFMVTGMDQVTEIGRVLGEQYGYK